MSFGQERAAWFRRAARMLDLVVGGLFVYAGVMKVLDESLCQFVVPNVLSMDDHGGRTAEFVSECHGVSDVQKNEECAALFQE